MEDGNTSPLGRVIRIDESEIRGHLDEMVRGTSIHPYPKGGRVAGIPFSLSYLTYPSHIRIPESHASYGMRRVRRVVFDSFSISRDSP